MEPTTITSQEGGPLHLALRAELEATRQAFQALLATLTPEDWYRPWSDCREYKTYQP